jgi:hypothetical protein
VQMHAHCDRADFTLPYHTIPTCEDSDGINMDVSTSLSDSLGGNKSSDDENQTVHMMVVF